MGSILMKKEDFLQQFILMSMFSFLSIAWGVFKFYDKKRCGIKEQMHLRKYEFQFEFGNESEWNV